MKVQNYIEIDLLKGLAICFVIILHSAFLSVESLRNYPIYEFLFLAAVPIFLVILGLTMSLSLNKRALENESHTLKSLYINYNLKAKLKRMLVPYVIIFLLDLMIAILFFDFRLKDLTIYNILFFKLAVHGVGEYYCLIYFQAILLFPVIYFCYKKNPRYTMLIVFIINFAHCFIVYLIFLYRNSIMLKINYPSFIFCGFFLFVLGVYIQNNYEKRYAKDFFIKNKFFILGFLMGFGYLVVFVYFTPKDFNLYMFSYYLKWLIGAFYFSVFVIIGLEFLPNKSRNLFSKCICYIGKASYHIFLVQLLYFGFLIPMRILYINIPILYIELHTILTIILYTFVNMVYCIILGILFYEFDKRYLKKIALLINLRKGNEN